MFPKTLVAVMIAMSASLASAETLPIARVFSAPALDGPTPRGVQISPDGSLISYLKSSPDDQTTFDLWIRPVKGGDPRRLLRGSEVEPKDAPLTEEEKGRRERQRIAGDHGVTSYRWDEAGEKILIPAGGDLYLADVKSGLVRPLGTQDGGATDAKISPRGRLVTYVKNQNLRVLTLSTGQDVALTQDGEGPVAYATAEFVAQEEMGRFTGYWVSPDDERIAFTRVDESSVDIVPRLDIGVSGSQLVNQRYPRAGRPNARVELYVGLSAGGERIKADLGTNLDTYLARVAWSKDSQVLYVERESRDQTQLDLLAVDPATGASKIVLSEHQTPWINLNDDLTPLTSGQFIWGSERTGFHHLYLYNSDGALIRPVTQGDWPVGQSSGAGLHASSIAGVDETRGLVYFVASKDSPLEQHLYVVSYLQPGEPRRITTGAGWWSVDLARDHQSFVGTFSDPRTPTQSGLYSISGGRLDWIEENPLAKGHPYFPYLDHKAYPQFGVLQAEDGQILHYMITKPAGFDPSKRYPAIVRVYGGPGAGSQVRKVWSGGTDQLLTQAGFVVFRLDNRGTSNRGLTFEAPLHRSMGGPELDDQIVGRRYLASLPYVDPARIGVMGWSYGGYVTLGLLARPDAGFAAGAAGAPPADWRLYDTHYTERYMGDPTVDALAYDRAALPPRLATLARPGAPRLLLLQGMADDNVIFENATRIMATLQDYAIPFDLMLYPGQRHGVQTPAKQVQLWKTYLAFFRRTLGGPQ